jgi:hypothetical protein
MYLTLWDGRRRIRSTALRYGAHAMAWFGRVYLGSALYLYGRAAAAIQLPFFFTKIHVT